MTNRNRRYFLKSFSAAAGLALFPGVSSWGAQLAAGDFAVPADSSEGRGVKGIKFGLCTFQWGAKADLPTLIRWCQEAGMDGLELRCQHAHGVEPEIGLAERAEVKKRFADSPVTLVGFGTNEDFHYPDPSDVKAHLERAKAYVKLSHDCGGFGIKVKPNALPEGIPREKTTAQIAAALEELGRFAADYGQVIRLENHGTCSPIPIMKEIIDQVNAPNVGLCWNCNGCDMDPPGVVENMKTVRNRLADTVHIHELDLESYPYDEMIRYLAEIDYNGWLLFEAHSEAENIPETMKKEKEAFRNLLS